MDLLQSSNLDKFLASYSTKCINAQTSSFEHYCMSLNVYCWSLEVFFAKFEFFLKF